MSEGDQLDEKVERIVVPFEVKAVDEDDRTFEGYAATWDLDSGDDIIHRGAFKETLAEWRKSSDSMPLLDSHNRFSILDALGQLVDGKEDAKGLWTKWEVIDGDDGDRVLSRLRPSKRTGRSVIGKMSIGYLPLKFDFTDDDRAKTGQLRHLRKVGLKESSLVIFPMNVNAIVDPSTVKMMLAKATPEERAALGKTFGELVDACKDGACGCSHEPEPSTDKSTAWEIPGSTPLDQLKARRFATRTQAIRGGLTTH